MMKKIFAGVLALLVVFFVVRCGKAVPFSYDTLLGKAVLGEGETRSDQSSVGAIHQVTRFVNAVAGASIPGYVGGDMPFNTVSRDFNQTVTDQNVPFSFTYSYPANNFKVARAVMRMDTSRDTSDTEGIFVNGVITGRPVNTHIQGTSPKITNSCYDVNPQNVAPGVEDPACLNRYFMDFSLSHYLHATRQTFELDLQNLLPAGTVTLVNALNDGFVPVVTSDDSPVYQSYLFIEGYTISKNAVACTPVTGLTFQNVYLHNDGNSIGQAAFSGTVETPFTSVSSAVAGFKSIEVFFDAKVPSVKESDLSLSTASLSATFARTADPVALVINGIGISQAGFDRSTATSVVESWNDSATPALDSFLASIPTSGVSTAATLNLVSLLGATKVRSLLFQGNLNLSFGGGMKSITASAATSSRTFGAPVTGPTISLTGTYSAQDCTIPADADSPLNDGPVLPPLPGDVTGPQVISLQASQITSNSAVIQWLTDEGADTQVGYGVGNANTLSALNTTLSAYHEVKLTGLSPYKYYFFQARTKDGNGNPTLSVMKVFRTLR